MSSAYTHLTVWDVQSWSLHQDKYVGRYVGPAFHHNERLKLPCVDSGEEESAETNSLVMGVHEHTWICVP